jgi:predicted Zn finger-like uncharacterized protein
MKIECDKCSAKYSIADEKVRGKTFKIRCKKCSNVIIVRDKVAAAAAGGGGGVDVAVDQAHPGWHLAINGETVGPMSEDEVRQRYDAGEIDKDTAIWQEGFEDWVPLGDVEGFADLPDRAVASGGDDPFASANQDDYAAAGLASPAVGAVGAGAMSFGQQPQAQMQSSPRVSSLTGQRNENSVLFSLDSLQALATGGGPSSPRATTRAASKGLATAAPGSEGSGLIDIRALGAMVNDGGGGGGRTMAPSAAADDTALPSFGGAGLGGLAAAPLVAHPIEPTGAAAAAMAHPPARSNAPLYLMMAVLIVAVVGLGVYIALKPAPEPVVVTQQNPEAPSVKAAGADEEDDEDDKDKDKDEDEDGEDEEGKDEEGEEEGGEEGEAAEGEGGLAGAGHSGHKSKGRSKGKSKHKSSGGGKDPLADLAGSGSSSKSSSSPSKSSSGKSDLDVDCILDPKACGKGKSPSSGGSKPSSGGGATDPSLPEKLSTTDIRNGIAPVKGSAKACGSKHGAKPGEKVKVKISISGATGAVTAANAQPPHTGTALGNCVAAALKRAKFKKFKKPSLGAVYPVSM